MLRYYEIIKEINDESEEKFEEFVERLNREKVCLILFGSRAKGKDNLLSDFDLLIITREKEDLTSSIDFPSDVFRYTFEECLKEIGKKNTVLLDAFTQGKLIFDNINVFDYLSNKVKREIDKSKLVRSKLGWLAGLEN
jgi:predicted nucleotidyltransferase